MHCPVLRDCKRWVCLIIFSFIGVAACILKSDEAVLRDEFGLSSGVTLAEMDVLQNSPDGSGGKDLLSMRDSFFQTNNLRIT